MGRWWSGTWICEEVALQVFRGSGQVYLTCGFSPDGRFLAAGGIGRLVDIWDTFDPTVPGRQLPVDESSVVHLAYADDGLLTICTARQPVRVVDPLGEWPERMVGQPNSMVITRGVCSKDGSHILLGGDQLGVVELAGWGREVWADDAMPGRVFAGVEYEPDGSRVAVSRVGVGYPVWSVIEIRDAACGLVLTEIPIRGQRPDKLSWSPDGRLLAGLVDKHLTVWETESWSEVFGPPEPPDGGDWLAVQFHSSGKSLLTGNATGAITCWEVGTWKSSVTLQWGSAPVYAFAFAPDGLRAAAAGHDRVTVWGIG